MEKLPPELILYITTFFEDPLDIVKLQHVCRRFLSITRDDKLWKAQCFEHSSFLEKLRRQREVTSAESIEEARLRELQRVLAQGNGLDGQSRNGEFNANKQGSKAKSNEKVRILANWDPSYPDESVSWYEEYIHRYAPISVSWLQQPKNRESASHEALEVRGMALYNPPEDPEQTLVVSPLDDGSICLWDLTGVSGQKGRIVARSKSGLLSVRGGGGDIPPGPRSKMVSTGVVECISVDSAQRTAYVAIQSSLIEVDLVTLQVVSDENFPWSITALSDAKHPTPVTVGTNSGLHLHDCRHKNSSNGIQTGDTRLDAFKSPLESPTSRSFRSIFNPEPTAAYATLYQPTPLSILHMPSSGDDWDGNGDIYVAGRFPSILNYDRRNFPKLRGTIHSGARLCSMAALPHPFASMEVDLMRRCELSVEQVQAAKQLPGKTIVACGEYNSKGSLEMYGLSSLPHLTNNTSHPAAGRLQNSTLKNRQTSSSSKLLSVANHGTRLVFSDGSGNLKWVERDGCTEVRRWNLSHGENSGPRGIFGTLGDSYMDSSSGDIVRKILHTNTGQTKALNQNDLVLWTGDKLGLLNFSSKPGFTAESFEVEAKSSQDAHREREERIYGETMRRALERQADEVRYMTGLGLGSD